MPVPIAVALDTLREAELRALILAVIEDRCSSLALDDEHDRETCAASIAAALVARGVAS